MTGKPASHAWYLGPMRLAVASSLAGSVACVAACAIGCSETRPAAITEAEAGTHVPASPVPDGDGGTGYCATHAAGSAFCDDFDHGALGTGWDFVQPTPPGRATLDTITFLSPPAALVVATEVVADAELASIFFRKTEKGSPSRAVLGFDVFADDIQATGTLAVATLDLAVDHLLTLYLRDDDPIAAGPTLTEVAPGANVAVRNPLAKVPAAGAWSRIELDVDTRRAVAVVRLNGATILTAPIAKAAAKDPTVRVGALVSGPAAAYTLRFDDVTLDVTP